MDTKAIRARWAQKLHTCDAPNLAVSRDALVAVAAELPDKLRKRLPRRALTGSGVQVVVPCDLLEEVTEYEPQSSSNVSGRKKPSVDPPPHDGNGGSSS